jgi:hypothetical protein
VVAVRAPPLLAGLAVGDLLAFARWIERVVHVARVLGVVEGLEVPDVARPGCGAPVVRRTPYRASGSAAYVCTVPRSA